MSLEYARPAGASTWASSAACVLLAVAGPDDHGLVDRLAGRLPGPRGPVRRLVRPDRAQADRPGFVRGGGQVLPDGQLRRGLLRLRPGLRLRDSTGAARLSPRVSAAGAPARAVGLGLILTALLLQDRRRALPHVGPRRLRGRADPGDRLPDRRSQGGRAGRPAPDRSSPLERRRPAPSVFGRR
ncbi:MAG: hypothetical protein MZV70_66590 [Desulfobacterales bacterium]|nr:hypothetical protein [Desulfobacterales bacterium]